MVHVAIPKTKRMNLAMAGDLQRDQYVERPPINQTFLHVLRAIVQNSDPIRRKRLTLALGMTPEESKKHDDVGVFSEDIDHFRCTVNWTTQSAGQIPPGHILVEYAGEEMGMLAPFTTGTLQNGVPAQNWWKGRLVSEEMLKQAALDLREAAATSIAEAVDKTKTRKGERVFDHYGGQQAQDKKAIA